MCEVCRSYIFEAEEEKRIINSTRHRTQDGVMNTSSEDQMSNRYKYSTDANVQWEEEEENGIY